MLATFLGTCQQFVKLCMAYPLLFDIPSNFNTGYSSCIHYMILHAADALLAIIYLMLSDI